VSGGVDFLADTEPVLAIEIDGEARAYPIQIMTWHEIVNDTIAGIPVAISYCPLCNPTSAYERRLGGEIVRHLGTAVPLGPGDVRPPNRVAVEPLHRRGGRGRADRREARDRSRLDGGVGGLEGHES